MRIELVGIELVGHHGALEEERRTGQRFLFDLELELRDERAGATDRLADTVDYREAVAIVRTVSTSRDYHLLEALASTIADSLLQRLDLDAVRVRVRKPEVILTLPVTHAAVVVERHRAGTDHPSGAEPTTRR